MFVYDSCTQPIISAGRQQDAWRREGDHSIGTHIVGSITSIGTPSLASTLLMASTPSIIPYNHRVLHSPVFLSCSIGGPFDLILDWTEEINTDPESLHIELIDCYGTVNAQVCSVSNTHYDGSATEDGETYLILASVGPRGMDVQCDVSVDLTFRPANGTISERVFINPHDEVCWVQHANLAAEDRSTTAENINSAVDSEEDETWERPDVLALPS